MVAPAIGSRWANFGRGVACCALAAVVGFVGTFTHWSTLRLGPVRAFPSGLIIACLAMAAIGVLARAWAGLAGVTGASLGALTVTQWLALPGPGGDLVVAGVALGYAWLVLAPVACMAPVFAPRRWFARPSPAPPPPPVPVMPLEFVTDGEGGPWEDRNELHEQ